MIPRTLAATAKDRMTRHPVLTVTGPRQSGKTSLCKMAFPGFAYANLEDPDTRSRATADPRTFLASSATGLVLDEVQRTPELLSYVQVLVDERRSNGQFVLSGSHNFQLDRAIGQSLAGRTSILELLPPAFDELQRFASPPTSLDDVLRTGAYPRIHDQHVPAAEFLAGYVRTYVERDVRLVTNVQDLGLFQTFLRLAASRSGQLLNLASLAADVGISQPTANAWTSILETSYLALRVAPWHRNFGKRHVKSKKFYLLDSGLLCWLLGIRASDQLATHPLRGAVFETWVVTEILKARWNRGVSEPMWFYGEQGRAEVDLVLELPGRIVLVEIKAGARIAEDATQHLDRVASLVAKEPMLVGQVERVVIYAGTSRENRNGTTFLPWQEIPHYAWA